MKTANEVKTISFLVSKEYLAHLEEACFAILDILL